jgi:hypothetical protein
VPLVVDARAAVGTPRDLPALLLHQLRQAPQLIGVPETLLLLGLARHPHGDDHPRRCHHFVRAHFTSPFDPSMYGKTYFGNERTTFVLDADGTVVQVLRKVKPAEHDERVLKALADLTSTSA